MFLKNVFFHWKHSCYYTRESVSRRKQKFQNQKIGHKNINWSKKQIFMWNFFPKDSISTFTYLWSPHFTPIETWNTWKLTELYIITSNGTRTCYFHLNLILAFFKNLYSLALASYTIIFTYLKLLHLFKSELKTVQS